MGVLFGTGPVIVTVQVIGEMGHRLKPEAETHYVDSSGSEQIEPGRLT